MFKLLFFLSLCAYGQIATIAHTSGDPLKTVTNELFNGNLNISLNNPQNASPLTSGSQPLTGANKSVSVVNGVFSVQLYANDMISPAGTSYLVRVQPKGQQPYSEYWIVLNGHTKVQQVRVATAPIPTVLFSLNQLSQSGAALNNVPIWNGTAWVPGAGGSGISSLNGLAGSSQTFSAINDTNVTLGIGSSGTVHTYTLGFTGTLAKARQNTATAYKDAANAFTTGLQDFGAALLKLPAATSLPGTCVVGEIYFDTDAAAGQNVYGCTATNTWTANNGPAAIQTLNSQSGVTQTLAVANETNLTGSFFSASNTHTLNLVWAGTLAKARQNAATAYIDAANTYSAGLQDFGAVPLKVPSSTTLPGTCSVGQVYFDTDAATGQNFYGCTSTNTWTLMSGGSAITTLNSQTGASQSFSTVNDTNFTVAFSSSSNVHTLTAGFTGTFAKARQNAATVYNDTANTYSTGLQHFGAASLLVPVSTSLPGTCSVGQIYFDSDATTGQNFYGCTATNTWTVMGDGGGGGGGVSTGAQLSANDYTPTRTSDTVLTLPAVAANAMKIGGSYACPTAISSGATFTITSGTGTLWIALGSDCLVKVRHNVVGTCSAGCTAVGSASGFDITDLALYQWGVTSGVLAVTGTLKLTPYNSVSFLPGTGITFSNSNGVTTINAAAVPSNPYLAAAACQNTTAYLLWDTFTSFQPTPACITGTNITKGVADFPDGANTYSLQQTLILPTDWTGTLDADIEWLTTATTGNVVWQIQTACTADNAADDPVFNTASTVTDGAKSTTNYANRATISNIVSTGCDAGEILHLKFLRNPAHGSDTLAATARLVAVVLRYRRTI
jgi:hypothetical protein